MQPYKYLGLTVRDFETEISELTSEEKMILGGSLFNLIEGCLVLSGIAMSLGLGEPPMQARLGAVAFHDLIWNAILELKDECKGELARWN